MKRFLALILILASMLSLCACGTSKRVRAEHALDEMGITDRDSQNALIDAALELDSDADDNIPSDKKMDKIYKQSYEQYGSQLEGEWICVSRWFTDEKYAPDNANSFDNLTIRGNSFIFNKNTEQTWLVEDSKILAGYYMNMGVSGRWNVKELELKMVNGFEMLQTVEEEKVSWFVRAEQAEALYDAMVYDLTLTNDNVKDNFELRLIHQEQIDSFGDKTGKFRDVIFLCNKVHDDGFVCLNFNDVQIEVSVPKYGFTQGAYSFYMNPHNRDAFAPLSHEVITVAENTGVSEMKADITPDDITIGRAKGTIKYLRPEFVDHIDEHKAYDLFGNDYWLYNNPVPPETF